MNSMQRCIISYQKFEFVHELFGHCEIEMMRLQRAKDEIGGKESWRKTVAIRPRMPAPSLPNAVSHFEEY